MLLLGGITSLPEIAAADAVLGRDAINSVIGRPTTLM